MREKNVPDNGKYQCQVGGTTIFPDSLTSGPMKVSSCGSVLMVVDEFHGCHILKCVVSPFLIYIPSRIANGLAVQEA